MTNRNLRPIPEATFQMDYYVQTVSGGNKEASWL